MKKRNLKPQVSRPIQRSLLATDSVSKVIGEETGVMPSYHLQDCQLYDRNNWWYRCTYIRDPFQPL